MRLYLLPPSFSENQSSVEITGKDYNYLINVLRLKKGQKIMGRDRSGGIWNLEITATDKTRCILSVEKADSLSAQTDAVPQHAPLKPIVLYQCLPKGRKADDIIKKATEAGVRDIVLVKSRNCVADLDGKEDSRLSRYDAIVTEAIQQSGSVVPTRVHGVLPFKDIAKDFETRFIFKLSYRTANPIYGIFTIRTIKSIMDNTNRVTTTKNLVASFIF